MTQQTIVLGRKKYAVGLYWQPVGDGVLPRNLARKMAKSVAGHTKYYVSALGVVGVGSRTFGHRPRMNVLALSVAAAMSGVSSFVAVFAVPNGFYLTAVRSGVIIADHLYPTADAAKTQFSEFLQMPDWGTVIAPDDWRVPRAAERDIGAVISGNDNFILQPVSTFAGTAVVIIVAIILIVVVVGVLHNPVVEIMNPVETPQTPKAASVSEPVLPAQAPIPAPVTVKYPYDFIPNINTRATVCTNAIAMLMGIVPGWNQVSADCTGGTATAHLHRDFGLLAGAVEFVKTNIPNGELSANSDSDITITMPLQQLPTTSHLSESAAQDVVEEIASVFQLMNQAADVHATTENVPASDDTMRTVNLVSVSAQSKITPIEFVKIFGDYDSAVLQSAAWDTKTNTWKYEVKIYVK